MVFNALLPQMELYQVSTWGEVRSTLQQRSVDLALLDLSMPSECAWQEELPRLCQQYSTVKFCILSACAVPQVIQETFQLGVKGYITKLMDIEEMQAALVKIMAGGIYFPPQFFPAQAAVPAASPPLLTRRQQEIVTLLARGNSNKQIGLTLGVTENTVKRHVYDLFKVLNATNRVEAIEASRRRGLIA